MSEWPPQLIIGLFFTAGLLFSICGTWVIERWLGKRKQSRRAVSFQHHHREKM